MDDWAFLLERARASYRRAGRPPRVTAAVSGGADSAALLLVLAQLSREEGFALRCAHVDHGLRAESPADAAFVEEMCRELSVPCRVVRVDVHGRSENAAREARYTALLAAWPDSGTDCLALAHHQRDQAETVLLHLFRGGGGMGLSGMTEWSVHENPFGQTPLWRPFLRVPPERIRAALKEINAAWREDATNAEDRYLRNYIRHRVLPAVRARIPQAEEAMGRAAEVLAAEADYFRRETERALRGHCCLRDPCRWADFRLLQGMHPALRRHAVRFLSPVPLDFAATEALSSLTPGDTANLPMGWRAAVYGDQMCFLPPENAAFPDATPDPSLLRTLPRNGETGDGRRSQAFPREALAGCELRTRRPGDRIRPLGAPGDKSLQDYFVDKKIPRPFRPYAPLLCRGSRVLWVLGVGPGEEARVDSGTDAVLLRYDGFLPGEGPGGNDQ